MSGTTTGANDFYGKLVEKEMQLYKINPNGCPKYLELLYKALKTIKPTSVEPERAFSAMGFFVTKIRNRMSNKTLIALITRKQHYKKPTKSCEDDSRAVTIGRPGSPVGPPGFWLLCIKSRNLMSRDH